MKRFYKAVRVQWYSDEILQTTENNWGPFFPDPESRDGSGCPLPASAGPGSHVTQPEPSSPAPVTPSRGCFQLTTALSCPPMGFAELAFQPLLASSHHHPQGGAQSWEWGLLLVFPDVLLMAGQGWAWPASWRSLWRPTESLRCCLGLWSGAMQMLSVAGFSFSVAPSLCWYLSVCIYSLTVWWTEPYLPKATEKKMCLWEGNCFSLQALSMSILKKTFLLWIF